MKFAFTVEARITFVIEVEAETLKQAVAQAQDSPVMTLCHQCATGSHGEWTTSGELDADPAAAPLENAYCDGREVTSKARKLW